MMALRGARGRSGVRIIYLIFLDSFCPEYKEKVAELLAKTDEL